MGKDTIVENQELKKIKKAIRLKLKGAIKTKGGLLIPGDPSIGISDIPGIWADRDDITKESLRRKAWGYDAR
ncbi:MAG: hypothetical protein LH606_02505 [Cytophagaceae bacterium]|nr:hypothetical protein [Cytophagaceae bacterium]